MQQGGQLPLEGPTASALPLSSWAIHHGEGEAPATTTATPLQVAPQGAQALGTKADPLLDVEAPPLPLSYQQGTYAPSAPPAVLQPGYMPGQPVPSAPASGAFFPSPQAAATAPPLSAGPQLAAPTFGPWSACALLFNVAVFAVLVCVGLDVNGQRKAFGAAAGVLYVVYLLVCLCSPSAKALRNHMDTAGLLAHTQSVRAARPEVWAAIVCYHHETRTRHVTRKGKDGKSHSHTETYTVKVVTHSARGTWGYATCRDTSGPPVYQPYLSTLEVHFKPCVAHCASLPLLSLSTSPLPILPPHLFFLGLPPLLAARSVQDFLDQASFAAFHSWQSSFFAANRRDVHQDTSSGMDIAGWVPYIMLQQGTSWVVGPLPHALAVLCGLGIVYECAVFQRTPRAKYFIVKQLGIY